MSKCIFVCRITINIIYFMHCKVLVMKNGGLNFISFYLTYSKNTSVFLEI